MTGITLASLSWVVGVITGFVSFVGGLDAILGAGAGLVELIFAEMANISNLIC